IVRPPKFDTHVFSCLFINNPPPTDFYTFPYTTLFRSLAGAAPRPGRPPAAAAQRRDPPAGRTRLGRPHAAARRPGAVPPALRRSDRKSTRLNSSHVKISYAVFCLKKKKTKYIPTK